MIETAQIYSLAGLIIFIFGFYALIVHSHLLRKILAVNFISSGVFLVLVATAYSPAAGGIDPVPQAMVLTGIVVSVSTTALALVLACRVQKTCSKTHLKKLFSISGKR